MIIFGLFIIIVILLLVQYISNRRLKFNISLRKKIDDSFKDDRNKIQGDIIVDGEQIKCGNGELILALDDDEHVINFLRTVFTRYGFNVAVFTDYIKAIEYFKINSDKVNVIVTDYSLPGVEGIDIIRSFKNINKNVPLIVFTGYSYIIFDNEEDKKLIDLCLYKPLRPVDIIKGVKKVLNKECK